MTRREPAPGELCAPAGRPSPRPARVLPLGALLLACLATLAAGISVDGLPTARPGHRATGAAAPAAAPDGAEVAAPAVRRVGDLQVLEALRRDGLQYTWRPRVAQVGPGGACGTNVGSTAGTGTFFVEEQACAEDVVVPALLDGDRGAIGTALQALEWALARQGPDGDFPGGADAFHSTSVFLASAARVVLLVRESPYAAEYAARLEPVVARLVLAARYEARPDVLAAGRHGDAPYGHRRLLLGAALGLAGDLTRDDALLAAARRALEEGLSLQRPDGAVPELGGTDSHYQAYGLNFAEVWLLHNPRDPVAGAVAEALDRGCAWEAAQVGADGAVATAGNTRTAGQERYRDGSRKRLVYSSVVRALGQWAVLRSSAELHGVAERVAAYKQRHPDA